MIGTDGFGDADESGRAGGEDPSRGGFGLGLGKGVIKGEAGEEGHVRFSICHLHPAAPSM